MLTKVLIRLLTPLLLLNGLLFSNTLFENKLSSLAQTRQWHKLLHYKNGMSEIDDKAFFLSKNGKYTPRDELKATITKLQNDTSDDENSTLCRYPSRSTWILEQLPELKKDIHIPQCKALKKEIKLLGAKQVSLVFASAYINSPASAFGHTFLRIDENSKTPLLSYAVNYSAQINQDNALVYAYKGLFGGYRGHYSLEPYYEKLKTYSNLEQRDIWEYTLDLTPEEIHRMVLHIFEIRHFYADYFFLSENCSYNLLWLIEVAKKDVELTQYFNTKAMPIDTIRILGSQNLIKETHYRASKRKEILQLSNPIKNNPKALTFAKSKEYNLSQITNLSKEEKIASLELATALLQIDYSNREIEKRLYLETFLMLLQQRSQLGKKEPSTIKEPLSPQEGHASAKAVFAYTRTNQALSARIKVAYHDIYDNEAGYTAGSYINFFDTAVEYKGNKFVLDEINLVDIRSYAIQDTVFKPISWQFSLGAKRIFDHELYSYVQAGAGFTLGVEELFGYATLTPTLYYKSQEEESLSANVGLLYNPSSKVKIGILSTYEYFEKERTIESVEPFITYGFTSNHALHLNYSSKKMKRLKEEELALSWFWYF